MTKIAAIENKIASIKRYLEIVRTFKKFSTKQIRNDVALRGAVERYLYLVCQATIDLADQVIAFKRLRKPETMSDAFYVLQDAKVITGALSSKLIRMVGFRNVLAHDYDRIDYEIVHASIHEGTKDIVEFVKKAKKAVEK